MCELTNGEIHTLKIPTIAYKVINKEGTGAFYPPRFETEKGTPRDALLLRSVRENWNSGKVYTARLRREPADAGWFFFNYPTPRDFSMTSFITCGGFHVFRLEEDAQHYAKELKVYKAKEAFKVVKVLVWGQSMDFIRPQAKLKSRFNLNPTANGMAVEFCTIAERD